MVNAAALLILLSIFAPQATADTVTAGESASLNTSQSHDLDATDGFNGSCVNVCRHFLHNKPEYADGKLYRQNCRQAKKETDEMSTLYGAGKAFASIIAQATYKCAPQSVAKMWKSTKELFTGTPESRAREAERRKYLDDCDASPECKMYHTRRRTIFSQRKPDGSYLVSDDVVQSYAESTPAYQIVMDAERDAVAKRGSCTQIAVRFALDNNLELGDPAHQGQILRGATKEDSQCAEYIDFPKPKTSDTIKAKSPLTFADLSITQRMLIGYGCLGDEFKKMAWEACSEGGQYLVPIPVATAVKVGKLGINALRGAKAANALSHVPMGHTVVSTLDNGDVLTRFATSEGKPGYKIFKTDGSVDTLRMDPSGMAVSANNDVIRAIAHRDLTSGDKAVSFIDVNHLGLVNYFKKGSEAGDQYLARVAEIVSEKAGPHATVYRWGGDEFLMVTNPKERAAMLAKGGDKELMVVSNATDKETVRRLNQSISDAIATDPKLRALFREEKIANAETYRSVSAARDYNELPKSFLETLTVEERSFASRHFDKFKERFQAVEAEKITQSAGVQPSISVGAALVGQRTPTEVIQLANEGAASCKLNYKVCMGLDVKKYQGRESYLPLDERSKGPRFLNTKPQVPETK